DIGPSCTAERTFFVISQQGNRIAEVSAARRCYDGRTKSMREEGIPWGCLCAVCIVRGPEISASQFSFRLHYKPYIRGLWFGGLLAVLGDFMAVGNARKPKLKGEK